MTFSFVAKACALTSFFTFISTPISALYSSSSPVRTINAQQLKDIRKSGDPAIVEFFSAGCGHCKNFAPAYEEAAGALKGIIKVYGVEDQAAMGAENISGFPTVKFISAGQKDVVYSDKRTASAVVDFAIKQMAELAKGRLGGKKSSEGEKKSSGDGHSGGKNVLTLTDTTFEKSLKDTPDDVWFVLFYAPWCGHCKAMMPDWEKTANSLKGKVKVAQVDATENSMLAQHFGIRGFPTIKLFPAGVDRRWTSLPSVAVSYEGDRTEPSFVPFAMQYAGKDVTAEQLLSQDQLDELCAKGVCLVAFLPHILDSKAAGRKALLKTYDAVLRASYSMPIKFFWSEGGEQFDFEDKLRLQFGFPAVVAINIEKNRFAVHRGTFEENPLRSFITGLMAGRQAIEPLPANLPKLKKVAAWDGKDAPEPGSDDEL